MLLVRPRDSEETGQESPGHQSVLVLAAPMAIELNHNSSFPRGYATVEQSKVDTADRGL
jgi:hypothetical protein